jgi:Glucosamine-6-phosphate isomerases/6-phosphogluconolactonase
VIFRIFEHKLELAEAAAARAATAIGGAIKERGQARIVAATGASQFEFLEALTATTGIEWQKVELFHLDEYIGIPISHPASFCKYLQDRLIDKTGITMLHLLNGADDPAEIVRRASNAIALLIPTIFTVNLYVLTLLFALATFSYASFTTIANVLPSDLYKNESVATVSGLSGTGAALGTIIVFELAGHLSDARIATGTHLFDPLMVIAGLIPFAGMILVLLLVRNTKATDQGLVRRI